MIETIAIGTYIVQLKGHNNFPDHQSWKVCWSFSTYQTSFQVAKACSYMAEWVIQLSITVLLRMPCEIAWIPTEYSQYNLPNSPHHTYSQELTIRTPLLQTQVSPLHEILNYTMHFVWNCPLDWSLTPRISVCIPHLNVRTIWDYIIVLTHLQSRLPTMQCNRSRRFGWRSTLQQLFLVLTGVATETE